MTEEEKKYWIAFSAFPGIGPLRFSLLLKYFGSARSAWLASPNEWREVGLGEKLVGRLVDFRRTFSVDVCLDALGKKSIQAIVSTDPAYPSLLAQISDAPFVLYVRGEIPQGHSVAVVGTRRITAYGKEVTRRITQGLVEAGVVVVSGLAYGVDTAAHETVVSMGGKTIAVLGCGVDVIYPRVNTDLYWRIINDNGAVVSEFFPGTITEKGLFPSRNRIISGLSLGMVLTEGTSDSGALITAKYAAQQGRDVFAVPGPITSDMSAAPMILLKQGAKLITCAQDVLEELNITNQPINKSSNHLISNTKTFGTDEEKMIFELLSIESLHFDVLVQKSGVSAATLGGILTMMEMQGTIKIVENGNYAIT